METEVIIVTSGKGGTGKTTFTANLGYSLAKEGFKTCIIDLDCTCGKLDIILGLESKVEYDISNIINNNKDVIGSLIKDRKIENLFLLASSRSNDEVRLTKEHLSIIIETLKENQFDFIVIDFPTDLNKDKLLNNLIQLSSKSIVITNPETPSLRDADSVISILENNIPNQSDNIFLVINKYIEPKIISKKGILKSKEIQRRLAIPLLGTIAYNTKNSLALNKSVPVVTVSNKALNNYKHIAKQIINMQKK